MYKVPPKVVRASKALCQAIIDNAGGTSAIANSLNLDRQYMHYCFKMGYVPPKNVYDVSCVLGVSPWSLSYYKLMAMLGEESPSLKSVIKTTPLYPDEKNRLISILE